MVKPMTTEKLYEYESLDYEKLPAGTDIKGLKDFLEKNDYTNALSFGYDKLEARHFVGSIKYKDFQLDIYPKYLASAEEDNGTQQLLKMLAYTQKLDIKNSQADSKCVSGDFLEVIIWYYAFSLLEGLKKHIPHHYRIREDNLNSIRGRIDFIHNIRYNFANKTKVFCKYDEFTEDNLLNRTLYFVSHLLYRWTNSPETKQIFRSIFAIYADIQLTAVTLNETRGIRLSKNQQEFFSTPLKLAQLFLEHSTVNLYANTLQNIAVLFDMNRLFEEFVAEKLKEELDKDKVESQVGQRLIDKFEPEHSGIETKKYIRTDILIKHRNNKIIIDTKYKDASKISSSDIYQMLAYAQMHDTKGPTKNLTKDTTKDLFLIYPEVCGKSFKCRAIFGKEINVNLHILTLDLRRDIKDINISKQIFSILEESEKNNLQMKLQLLNLQNSR